MDKSIDSDKKTYVKPEIKRVAIFSPQNVISGIGSKNFGSIRIKTHDDSLR